MMKDVDPARNLNISIPILIINDPWGERNLSMSLRHYPTVSKLKYMLCLHAQKIILDSGNLSTDVALIAR